MCGVKSYRTWLMYFTTGLDLWCRHFTLSFSRTCFSFIIRHSPGDLLCGSAGFVSMLALVLSALVGIGLDKRAV
jgi:hypothetical protein